MNQKHCGLIVLKIPCFFEDLLHPLKAMRRECEYIKWPSFAALEIDPDRLGSSPCRLCRKGTVGIGIRQKENLMLGCCDL